MTISHVELINRGEKKMGDAITFIIHGQPVAKGRLRTTICAGHIHHYSPDKTIRYENLVHLVASEAMRDLAPLTKPIALTIRAFMAVPKSWSLKKRQAVASDLTKPAKRPDLSNIVKAIEDGCNGVVWPDDAQIVECRASKHYGIPCVEIAGKEL